MRSGGWSRCEAATDDPIGEIGSGEETIVLTVGVEEEFLLLEPNGAVAPAAEEVLRAAGGGPHLTPEFMAYQLESATRV
jgi:carboxylate-amine ligase